MADHKKHAAWRHRRTEPACDIEHAAVGQVDEVGGHEVPLLAIRPKGADADAAGRDAVGDPGLRRMLRDPCQGGVGKVDSRDVPALRGQPEGIAALAAPDVERPTGCHVGDLGLELHVDLAAPDLVAAVALLPGRPLEVLRRRSATARVASSAASSALIHAPTRLPWAAEASRVMEMSVALLGQRAEDVLANVDRPRTCNGPTGAPNGRLEHLRDLALGLRNLTNYIARALLETGGLRPQHTLDCEDPLSVAWP